jgi:hypothetical protein
MPLGTATVSAEGVGVAPAIPTLGDRRASGRSIIGLAVFDGSALRAEAIGRCWSQGRMLAWLADSEVIAGNHGNRPEPIPFLHILAVSDHDVRGERGPLT